MVEDSKNSEITDMDEEQSESSEIIEEHIGVSEPRTWSRSPSDIIGLVLNTRMLRRVVQLVFLFGINAYILTAWFGIDSITAFWEGFRDLLPTLPIIAPLEAPFGVIGGSFDTMQREFTSGLFPFFTIGAMIIILTIIGRTACGWVCPIGTLQDFATLPNRSKSRPAPSSEKELRRVKAYIFFLVIFMAIWVGISTVLGTEDALVTLLGIFSDAAFDPANPAYILFVQIPSMMDSGIWPSGFDTLWRIGYWSVAFWLQLFFVVVTFVISFWHPRWFCRWLCPAGWFYGVFSRDALIGIGRNPARCTPDTCSKCEDVCPMNIRIRRYPYQHMHHPECIMCLDCKSHCPYGAIEIKFL